MVVKQYNWGQYDMVVDVGGGSGHFVMELLRNYPRLKGVVVDQSEQIARGKEVRKGKQGGGRGGAGELTNTDQQLQLNNGFWV